MAGDYNKYRDTLGEINVAITNEWERKYTDWFQKAIEAQMIATKPPEVPDDFDTFVAEVRKQDKLEKLIQAVYDDMLSHKKAVEE